MTEAAVLPDQWSVLEQRFKTLNKVMTTKAAIAQTPKETVWALNKARLYRYIPVVPPESRHPVPLLLVFALMNRPTILDLRPGHSFIEYMVSRGFDVYLLDWGVPGLEDKDLKFDDYVLDYMTRAIRKVKLLSGIQGIQSAGLVHRRNSYHHLCVDAARRWPAQPVAADGAARFFKAAAVDVCALDR